MNNESPELERGLQQRRLALSSWENEGGACLEIQQRAGSVDGQAASAPAMVDAELVLLRVRIIALENIVISLLAGSTDRQRDLAGEMVGFVSPRPGFTQHSLTIHAASQMRSLVERSARFRSAPAAPAPYTRTAVFDEVSLPAGLRKEHRTKRGVWGVIRVFDGRVRYKVLDSASEVILSPGLPGLILPDQSHCVQPIGPMRMQVEFYDQCPNL